MAAIERCLRQNPLARGQLQPQRGGATARARRIATLSEHPASRRGSDEAGRHSLHRSRKTLSGFGQYALRCVLEPGTFEHLLSSCFTVWVRTSPEEHMQRVIAQGDMRPMAHNRDAMSDLKRILAEREVLYSKADIQIDTAGRTFEESVETLIQALRDSPVRESLAPAALPH